MSRIDDTPNLTTDGFHRRVYSVGDISRPVNIPTDSIASAQTGTKIIPTEHLSADKYRDAFLPMLITINELRALITALNSGHDPYVNSQETPVSIQAKLNKIEDELKESMRWCQSVQLQLDKAKSEVNDLAPTTEDLSYRFTFQRVSKHLVNLTRDLTSRIFR